MEVVPQLEVLWENTLRLADDPVWSVSVIVALFYGVWLCLVEGE